MLSLIRPNSTELWTVARQLVEEYAASLNLDLSFQDFAHEVECLADEYGPPTGCFLLAAHGTSFIGCGALRKVSGSDCEMKRLYVVPTSRGGRIGLALAKALIEEARHLGYKRMLLDTLPSMGRAHELYASLGFRTTTPYRYNPVPGTSFLELPLH
jgi:GNAT superfamily N-acetyltransferase